MKIIENDQYGELNNMHAGPERVLLPFSSKKSFSSQILDLIKERENKTPNTWGGYYLFFSDEEKDRIRLLFKQIKGEEVWLWCNRCETFLSGLFKEAQHQVGCLVSSNIRFIIKIEGNTLTPDEMNENCSLYNLEITM